MTEQLKGFRGQAGPYFIDAFLPKAFPGYSPLSAESDNGSPHHGFAQVVTVVDGDYYPMGMATALLLAKSYELALFVQKVSEGVGYPHDKSLILHEIDLWKSEARALLASVIGE